MEAQQHTMLQHTMLQHTMLLVIYPAYCLNRGWFGPDLEEIYGNYDSYLERLYQAASERKSMLMPYLYDELRFKVPKTSVLTRDYGEGYEDHIDILKSKGILIVETCGEILWFYDKDDKVCDGALRLVENKLKEHFTVRTRRELCYPSKDPKIRRE